MKLLEWLVGKKPAIEAGQQWAQKKDGEVRYNNRASSYIVINEVSICGKHVLYSWESINGLTTESVPHEYEMTVRVLRRMFVLLEKDDVQ